MANAMLAEIPGWFKKTPSGSAMVAEAETTTIEERRQHVATIAAAELEFQKVAPKLQAARQKAEDNVNAAKAALARAENDYRVAYGYLATAQATRDSKAHKARTELKATAPGVAELGRDLLTLRESIMSQRGTFGRMDLSYDERDVVCRRALEVYRGLDELAMMPDPRPEVARLREEFGLPPIADAE